MTSEKRKHVPVPMKPHPGDKARGMMAPWPRKCAHCHDGEHDKCRKGACACTNAICHPVAVKKRRVAKGGKNDRPVAADRGVATAPRRAGRKQPVEAAGRAAPAKRARRAPGIYPGSVSG